MVIDQDKYTIYDFLQLKTVVANTIESNHDHAMEIVEDMMEEFKDMWYNLKLAVPYDESGKIEYAIKHIIQRPKHKSYEEFNDNHRNTNPSME